MGTRSSPARDRTIVTLVMLASLVPSAPSARATTVLAFAMQDLVGCASSIALVEVVAEDAHVLAGREGGMDEVETTWTVAVLEHVAGAEHIDAIACVRVPGGRAGSLVTIVPGTPRLVVGATYLLFLEPHSHGCSRVLGLAQGAFVVVDATDGSGAVARRDREHGAHVVGSEEVEPVPEELPLDQLLDAIAWRAGAPCRLRTAAP